MRKEVTHPYLQKMNKGHAALIRKNIFRAGISNSILHFKDGQELLDFLFKKERFAPSYKGSVIPFTIGYPDAQNRWGRSIAKYQKR